MDRFYYCSHCRNIIGMIDSKGVKVACCGEEMKPMVLNMVDASKEKHIPEVKVTGDLVEVEIGSVLHPMSLEHHISWVYIETTNGGQRKNIEVGKEPKVSFMLKNDKVLRVYAHCNLHGLWVKEL